MSGATFQSSMLMFNSRQIYVQEIFAAVGMAVKQSEDYRCVSAY